MSTQSEMSTSLSVAATGMGEIFQSIATELTIFCATLVVALIIKGFPCKHGCSGKWYHFWSLPPAPGSKWQSDKSQQSIKSFSPSSDSSRVMQAGGPRKASSRTTQIIETIMDRASNKSGIENLSLYAELLSSNPNLQIQSMLHSTRHSALDFYTALVQSAVRAGQPQVVEKLLDDMASAQIQRTLTFYESTMKVLAGKKHYKQAIAVYRRLQSEGVKASPVTLSCLINFAVELGDLDSAIGFFEQLSSTSTPSIRAYMMALRVYSKRQDWTKSLDIFHSMQAREVQIDSLILNSVLATGVAAGKIEATEALLHEVAKTNSEVVDVISYNTVLKGYAHQKSTNKALRILDSMLEQGVKPNGITFNTVMDAAVRGSQPEDAWKLLEQMRGLGIQPDKYTCTIMMKTLHEDLTPEQMSKAIEMIRAALPQCDVTLASSLFRGVLQAAARLNNAALLVRAFNGMKGQHVMPTTADYQLVIQTLAQQCDDERCSSMWQQVLTPAHLGANGGHQQHAAVLAIFTSIMEDLADKEKVEGMICAFGSLRTIVMAGKSEKGGKANHECDSQHLLQQCRAALIQAASRKQHSSPACRRLLELAPEHLMSS